MDAYPYGQDDVVLVGENEIDSIVSRLEENLYAPGQAARPFVSVSDRPVFNERREAALPGVDRPVFHGKALARDRGYVFSACGALSGEGGSRPLVLYPEELVFMTIAAGYF